MNVSRLAILGFALVAGVAAFFLMMSNRPEQAPVQVVKPVQEETVRVLVSTRDIPRGGRFTLEDTTWIAWPKKAVQPTFITDATPDAREALESAVARTLIVTGEPVIEAKLVRAGSSGLMAAVLEPGMRAVSMRISPETSVAGFVLPGDRVDLYYTEPDEVTNEIVFTMLLEDVRVLAIDAFYSEYSESANVGGGNLTVQLTPEDAEYFTTARQSKGQISLALRSIFEPETEIETKRRNDGVQVIRYGRS
ncbi:MAG: Flp pilus assembly protein CpaB [Pseudomonadota bacterium]